MLTKKQKIDADRTRDYHLLNDDISVSEYVEWANLVRGLRPGIFLSRGFIARSEKFAPGWTHQPASEEMQIEVIRALESASVEFLVSENYEIPSEIKGIMSSHGYAVLH